MEVISDFELHMHMFVWRNFKLCECIIIPSKISVLWLLQLSTETPCISEPRKQVEWIYVKWNNQIFVDRYMSFPSWIQLHLLLILTWAVLVVVIGGNRIITTQHNSAKLLKVGGGGWGLICIDSVVTSSINIAMCVFGILSHMTLL